MLSYSVREKFPDIDPHGKTRSSHYINYADLVIAFGHTIVVQGHVDDYQGDSFYLMQDGDQWALLVFGWGSCSGCDALQSALQHEGEERYEAMQDLVESLAMKTRWDSHAGMLSYLELADHRGQHYGGESAWGAFRSEAIAALEATS